MTQIGPGGTNPFANVELKDPAKKAEFDQKVQESLSDGVLTKEEFTKLKEDFIVKDQPGLDQLVAKLPSDNQVKMFLESMPNDSNRALAPLRARYEKVLPDLGKMLGTDITPTTPQFIILPTDKTTLTPMPEQPDPPLRLDLNKKTEQLQNNDPAKKPANTQDQTQRANLIDSGLFVNVAPIYVPPPPPMQVQDTPTLRVDLKASGKFVNVEPIVNTIQKMPEEPDPSLDLLKPKP